MNKKAILQLLAGDACQVLNEPPELLAEKARDYQANKAAFDFWHMINRHGLEYAELVPSQPWKELALLAIK